MTGCCVAGTLSTAGGGVTCSLVVPTVMAGRSEPANEKKAIIASRIATARPISQPFDPPDWVR